MGCTHCTRQKEPEVAINKTNQNGFKSLFYATSEFDLSRSESEDEEEQTFSLNSIKNSTKQQKITNGIVTSSNELNSTNKTSSTTVNGVLDDRVVQTGV